MDDGFEGVDGLHDRERSRVFILLSNIAETKERPGRERNVRALKGHVSRLLFQDQRGDVEPGLQRERIQRK